MKTKFGKQEKKKTKTKTISKKAEKIETMKTRINQVVAIAIFTLILFGGNSYAKGTELIASSLKTIEEPAMEMESWMIDEAYWNKTNSAYFFEEAFDEALNLEAWMFNESNWGKVDLNYAETEVENSLVLESWMTNENLWEKERLSFNETETENNLILESWMTDENTWNIQ